MNLLEGLASVWAANLLVFVLAAVYIRKVLR